MAKFTMSPCFTRIGPLLLPRDFLLPLLLSLETLLESLPSSFVASSEGFEGATERVETLSLLRIASAKAAEVDALLLHREGSLIASASFC